MNPAIIRRNKRALIRIQNNTFPRYMDRVMWKALRNYQRWLHVKGV